MNAIISLCHFCELHGPRVVFNTQAYRDPPSLALLDIDLHTSSKNLEKTENVQECSIETGEHLWKYGRVKDDCFKAPPSFTTDTCSACRSFPHNQAAIISNDNENQVTFVSSQYPFQEDIYTLVRQAGIRSLSCEDYSEREGPIYFGDPARGHVISYTFFLKDIHARGFLRRYSILVMMADKLFLLNSWSFFFKHLQQIIKHMQELAAKVYSVEEKLESLQAGFKPSVMHDNSKRHREAGNPRLLTELVGDKNIWITLHLRFTWILKAGGLRLQEKLVEVPPLLVSEIPKDGVNINFFMESIGKKTLLDLLNHIYTGNSVTFESCDSSLLQEIPSVLQPVVPEYIFHPIQFGELSEISEREMGNCNIITVCCPSSDSSHSQNFTLKFIPGRQKGDAEVTSYFHSYNVVVSDPFPLKIRPPQIVAKMLSLIEKKRFSSSVLNLYFASLIDEWTNKVKIWSYMSKNKELMSLQNQQSTQFLSPRATSPISQDKRGFLDRSSSPTPASSSNTLLTVAGTLECDVPMLTALSDAYERCAW